MSTFQLQYWACLLWSVLGRSPCDCLTVVNCNIARFCNARHGVSMTSILPVRSLSETRRPALWRILRGASPCTISLTRFVSPLVMPTRMPPTRRASYNSYRKPVWRERVNVRTLEIFLFSVLTEETGDAWDRSTFIIWRPIASPAFKFTTAEYLKLSRKASFEGGLGTAIANTGTSHDGQFTEQYLGSCIIHFIHH